MEFCVSRANRAALIFPSTPRSPKPPGIKTPATSLNWPSTPSCSVSASISFKIDSAILARGRVGERFVNALVSVLQVDVFADDGNSDLFLWTDDALDKFPPVRQIRFRVCEMQ